jgi:hypothetical protein
VREAFYDFLENPVADNNGIGIIENIYDSLGNLRRKDFYSVNKTGGIWGKSNLDHVMTIMDDKGLIKTQQFFDKDGRFTVNDFGMIVGCLSYYEGTEKRRLLDGISLPGVGCRYDKQTYRETLFYREDGSEERREMTDFQGNRKEIEKNLDGNVVSVKYDSSKENGIKDLDMYGVAQIKKNYGIAPSTLFERVVLKQGVKKKDVCTGEEYFDSTGKKTVNRFGFAERRKKTNYLTGEIGELMFFDALGNKINVVCGIIALRAVVPLGVGDNNGMKVGDIVCRLNEYNISAFNLNQFDSLMKTMKNKEKKVVLARRMADGTYKMISYSLPKGDLSVSFSKVYISYAYFYELMSAYKDFLKREK